MQPSLIISLLLLLSYVGCSEAVKGTRNAVLMPSKSDATMLTTTTAHTIIGSTSTQQHSEKQDDQIPQQRNLIIEKIWNWYQPRTMVSEIAAIDLDFQSIQKILGEETNNDKQNKFDQAEEIYKDGGHVDSTAVLQLVNPLDRKIPAGSRALIPITDKNEIGWGTVHEDVEAGDRLLMIKYPFGHKIDQHESICQVGALPDPITSGCFAESGTIEFPELVRSYNYTYNQLTGNVNLRTLFSLSMNQKSFVDHNTFIKYKTYYGSPLYMDEIISDALHARSMAPGQGSMDFSIFQDHGNGEVVEKSIVFLTIWMTVVGLLEEAVQKCNIGACETETCLDRPGVQEWDSAVAYYAGSLWDTPTHGKFLLYKANKLCKDFKTCGHRGGQADGNSYANHDIFHWFEMGQRDLLQDACNGAETAKYKIIQMMTIPIVQGVIYHTYKVESEMNKGINNIERYAGEASGYALALLPLLHYCNPDDANILYEHLKPKPKSSIVTDFATVKSTLERNYKCMNVRCHHVGGIYDHFTNSYKEGATPCHDLMVGLTEQQRGWAIALGVSLGTLIIMAIIVCAVGRRERSAPNITNDLQLQANTDAEMT